MSKTRVNYRLYQKHIGNIITLLASGYSYRSICKSLRISKNTLYKYLRKHREETNQEHEEIDFLLYRIFEAKRLIVKDAMHLFVNSQRKGLSPNAIIDIGLKVMYIINEYEKTADKLGYLDHRKEEKSQVDIREIVVFADEMATKLEEKYARINDQLKNKYEEKYGKLN